MWYILNCISGNSNLYYLKTLIAVASNFAEVDALNL